MRYFFINGTYVPKHCLYGPRPREAIFFDNWEWYDINENLFRSQRDRQLAEMNAAKEQTKKDMSYDMTKTWQNTLASIKTQSEQRRIEKRQKIIQGRIDEYNKIIESRKEEKKPILDQVKKALFESRESTRTIVSALLESAAIKEREKQLELKRQMKEEEDRKDAAYALKIKVDAEAFLAEQMERKLLKRSKRSSKYVLELEQQIKNNRERAKEARAKELRGEQEDLAKMKEKNEMLKKCREKEKSDSVKRTRAGYEKGFHESELGKTKLMEEEEENEINRMIIKYDKRFKKERKQKEEKMIAELIENRQKMVDVLAQKLMAEKHSDDDRILRAIHEREEEEEAKARREKEEEKRKAAEEMKTWKLKHNAQVEHQRALEMEAFKWTVLQNERRREVNKEFEENLKRSVREKKAEMKKAYDEQIEEMKQFAVEAEEEDRRFLDKPEDVKEDTLRYCEEAIEYAKARGWNEYPVVSAAAKLKKGFLKEKTEATETAEKDFGPKMHVSNGNGLYCFKC